MSGEEPGRRPHGGAAAAAPYAKLKPGPGRSAQAVQEHQRERLHRAMIELVAERGYEAVTVRELAARAGVSQRTLYERFGSKQGCFLDTYELIVRRGVQRTLAAQRSAATWPERLRLGVRAFVAELGREPAAAHFALVDCFSAWPYSLEHMRHTAGLFDALLADSVAHAPDGGVALSPYLSKAIVAGIGTVVRERLLTGRERELAGLGDELADWSLSLLGDRTDGLGRLYEPAALAPPVPLLREPQAARDERSGLLSASACLAAEDGFDQLTVPRIRAAAGLPRRSFDAHFKDATDCFLAAVESYNGQALAHAVRAGAACGEWPGSVCRMIASLADLAAGDERLGRILFVETFAPGPAGVRCRARLLAETAAGFHRSAPAAQRPSLVAAEASMGGIWGLAYDEIAAGRPRRLGEFAASLAFVALAPAIGTEAAVSAIEAERRGAGGCGEETTTARTAIPAS